MKLQFLEPDEELYAERHSTLNQHSNKLSVLKGGSWAPIVSDALDYIACGKIACHPIIITDDSQDDGYAYDKCTYYTKLSAEQDISDDGDKMQLLEPDENLEFARIGRDSAYKDYLSVLMANKWVPIEYDALDFISCGHVETHKEIVTDDQNNDANSITDCSYFTILTSPGKSVADDAERARLLTAEEKPDVFWHSSISQHKNMLSVMQRGEWVPISYDVLDYIACDRVACHPAIVTDGDDIGFDFSVAEQTFFTDKYIYHDEYGTELRELPHWFGEGMYEAFYHNSSFVNSDESALGERTKETRRVGLSYALAKKTLEADE